MLGALTILAVFVRKIYILVRRPVEKIAEKDDDQKQEKAKRISSENSRKIEALCEKGKMLAQRGDEDEAIKNFVQALTLDPAHLETKQELAKLYINKQMFSAASALLNELAETTNDPVHHSLLGFALFQQNEFETALVAYQKAVDLDSARPQRFVSLCQVYRALQRPTPAIIALNKALDLEPGNVESLFLMSDLQIETENLGGAFEALTKILQIDPENIEARNLLKKLKGA